METILSFPDSHTILGRQAWKALSLVEPFLLGLHATGRGWTRSQGVLVTANLMGMLTGGVGWALLTSGIPPILYKSGFSSFFSILGPIQLFNTSGHG